MAMQTGLGLSKILIIVGAGYTGSIMLKNGKLSDVLGDLQSLLKGLEKSGNSSDADSDFSDALATQVRRLAMEVRQLASARPITVLNGHSGQMGNMTSLIVPAATLGALGYGYMWWKGLSFSDLMYVTKRNMANAVTSLTKNLEQVTEALAATKRHLTQRIENLDGKVDEQKEISKLIKNEVTIVREDLSQIGFDLEGLHRMVKGLDGKIGTLEVKQDFANTGVLYLCQVAGLKDEKMAEVLQTLPQAANKRAFLGYTESNSLKGLQHIADTIKSGTIDKSKTDAIFHNDTDSLENHPRSLTRMISCRTVSIK